MCHWARRVDIITLSSAWPAISLGATRSNNGRNQRFSSLGQKRFHTGFNNVADRAHLSGSQVDSSDNEGGRRPWPLGDGWQPAFTPDLALIHRRSASLGGRDSVDQGSVILWAGVALKTLT